MSDQGNLFGSTPHGTFNTPGPPDTLAQERARLKVDRTAPGGTCCKACNQTVGERAKSIDLNMVGGLRAVFLSAGLKWCHHTRVMSTDQGGDYAKLRWWGLIELDPETRGHSRVTERGREYLYGQVKLARQARHYNRTFYGFVDEEDYAGVAQVHGFDEAEHMQGVPPYGSWA